MELSNSVRSHQPDEIVTGESPLERSKRVDGVARARALFEITDPNGCQAGHCPSRSQARRIWRHALGRLERIARRDQPPQLVEAKRINCRKAELAVPAMGRVEGAAEEADALHVDPLAWPHLLAY
jgi:hypothetical protein